MPFVERELAAYPTGPVEEVVVIKLSRVEAQKLRSLIAYSEWDNRQDFEPLSLAMLHAGVQIAPLGFVIKPE